MMNDEFTEALATECRTATTKVEDFFAALTELASEILERGEMVRLGNLGLLGLRPYLEPSKNRKRMSVTFYASDQLRERLKLVAPPTKRGPGLCECGCGRKRHVAVYKKSKACIQAQTRARKEGEGNRAKKNGAKAA